MKNFKTISNSELVSMLKDLSREERRIGLEVLHYLREVEARRLFAFHAYSSLHEFCVKELGYSAGAAQRRIDSMRLLKDVPEVETKILEGKLNLSILSQVQNYVKYERKETKRTVSKEEKQKLLESFYGKSVRDVQKELITKAPGMAVKFQESMRAISETETALRIVADEELMALLKQAQSLGGNSGEDLSVLLKRMAKVFIEKKMGTKNKSTPAPESQRVTRYITKSEQSALRTRAQNQCEWKIGERRCIATKQLQIDHIHPFAKGGNNELKNLQLLCPAHNRFKAVQDYGQEKMRMFLKS